MLALAGNRRPLKDPSGTVHHVIFVLVTSYVLHNSIFKFPFTWLSLCEASTPFVNYRQVLWLPLQATMHGYGCMAVCRTYWLGCRAHVDNLHAEWIRV